MRQTYKRCWWSQLLGTDTLGRELGMLAENYPNRLSDSDKVWQQLCLVCVRSAAPVAEHELPCNSKIQNTTVSLSRSTLAPRV